MPLPVTPTTLPAPARATIEYYSAKTLGTNGVGVYTAEDWARLGSALDLTIGKTVLDIGVGNGALLHMLARSGKHEHITGVDVRRHSLLDLPEGVDYRLMSVAKLDFPDKAFDCVVCMEVLEHLETTDYERALVELRRVTAERLVVTVPFCEPLPLWWHDKPGGHRQQLTVPRILREFPSARAFFQKRAGVDWIFLVEDLEPGLPSTGLPTVQALLANK